MRLPQKYQTKCPKNTKQNASKIPNNLYGQGNSTTFVVVNVSLEWIILEEQRMNTLAFYWHLLVLYS